MAYKQFFIYAYSIANAVASVKTPKRLNYALFAIFLGSEVTNMQMDDIPQLLRTPIS